MTPEHLVTIDDMFVGRRLGHRVTVTQGMIDAYADLTGDYNPVHVDPVYAATTRFGGCIAHGMLTCSFVQVPLTAMVTPGGISTFYHFDLLGPVYDGDELEVVAECVEVDTARRRAKFRLAISSARGDVVSGEAGIAFPRATNKGEGGKG
jgi:3-hydroxybutyryl-CoA dehydratase